MSRRIAPGIMTGLLALALHGEPASAQAAPEGLVWMALNDINGDAFDPDDPTNRPALVTTPPEGMIRAVEVNGDDRPDWLVDYGRSGLSRFCGTGGCTQKLYVSGGDTGYRRAFDNQALAFDVIVRNGETRIEARVHSLHCRPERAECLFAWAWDEGEGRLVERPARDGETVLEDGGFDPVDIAAQNLPDILPEDLSPAWFGGRLTCADQSDAGFETRRPAFRSVPDLNGDGRRDWIEIPALCPMLEGAQTQFSVWTTTPAGGLETTYVSPMEHYPAVDIGSTPATLLSRPLCDDDATCEPVRLRWDAGEGRFNPET